MSKVKDFIEGISTNSYSDAKDAISSIIADKYQSRIEAIQEKLGLVVEKKGKKKKIADDEVEPDGDLDDMPKEDEEDDLPRSRRGRKPTRRSKEVEAEEPRIRVESKDIDVTKCPNCGGKNNLKKGDKMPVGRYAGLALCNKCKKGMKKNAEGELV